MFGDPPPHQPPPEPPGDPEVFQAGSELPPLPPPVAVIGTPKYEGVPLEPLEGGPDPAPPEPT